MISKKLFFWLMFVIIFAIFPLVLFEAGGRLYIYFKHGVPGKSYGLWRDDKVLGVQHKENAYNMTSETNNWGFRNKEDVPARKPENSLRLIAYGGSTTFCYNLSNDEAWPVQLQGILREERNINDQVLNGGAINWSLGHLYARAKKDIPALKPDYVIIYSGINEPTNAAYLSAQGKSLKKMTADGIYGAFATNYDQNRWSKRNLLTVKAIDYVIQPLLSRYRHKKGKVGEVSGDTDINPDPVISNNYLHVLEEFIKLITDNGGKVVFVIQAQGKDAYGTLQLTSYSLSGASLAEKQGAIVIDAREVVSEYEGDPMDLFADSGVHYSALGAKKLADYLFREAFHDQYGEK